MCGADHKVPAGEGVDRRHGLEEPCAHLDSRIPAYRPVMYRKMALRFQMSHFKYGPFVNVFVVLSDKDTTACSCIQIEYSGRPAQACLGKLKFVEHICRVFVPLPDTQTGCGHLRAESRIVLHHLAFLVPTKGISSEVRVC